MKNLLTSVFRLSPQAASAVDFVRNSCPQLILMDMNYSKTTTGEEGVELLAKVKIFCPDVPVILFTAWGSINLAVRGICAGAFDFVTKPWNNLALLNIVQTAIQVNEEVGKDTLSAPTPGAQTFRRDKIIGKSPLLLRIFDTAAHSPHQRARADNGRERHGQEQIAEAIRENSSLGRDAYVKVNLGGISQSLFESEMFGHKKGAFTDAHLRPQGSLRTGRQGQHISGRDRRT